MTILKRTDFANPHFTALVKELDADLASRDGAEHAFYAQFNKLSKIKYAVVAYEDDMPVACGAMREFAPGTIEVKRMYTLPVCRGRGIAVKLLAELELWAAEMKYATCILETGKKQPEAIALYKRCGYTIIPAYGQYLNIENSMCFEKRLPGS